MEELVLSKSDFRAFSSDTRARIAKLLRERNHTLSELSKKLGMASPTVKTHLDKLAQANIVQQLDEGRKWKYYSLTRKGRKLLEPEAQPAVMIVIGVSAVVLVGTIFLLAQSMPGIGSASADQLRAGIAPSYSASQSAAQAGAAEEKPAAPAGQGLGPSLPGLVFLAVMAAFVLGYFIALERTRKARQW